MQWCMGTNTHTYKHAHLQVGEMEMKKEGERYFKNNIKVPTDYVPMWSVGKEARSLVKTCCGHQE